VPTVPPARPVAVEEWADVELVRQNAQFKACDFCGESILVIARKCKHCGETLDPSLRAAEEAQRSAEQASRRSGGGGTVIVESPREFPHLIHAVITVFFCGAWLPVWILHYALSGREGGKAIAWLVGIPLCVCVLACGGCLTIGMVGSIMSPRSDRAGADGKDSRKLANSDTVGDERQNGPEPNGNPDANPKSERENDKDAERRRKQDQADKKRADEKEAERKKNDPEEIRKRELPKRRRRSWKTMRPKPLAC
jgi:hypothetical protein